jgi:hypothetical protein
MAELGAFLLDLGSERRQLGVHDCCTMPCDWAVLNGWPDPMATWRGAYSTAEEAEAFIADAGGLLALFERGFDGAGIPRREGPASIGDVGVLRIGDLEAGSICTGKRWAFIGERGIGMASVDPDAVAATWATGG